MRGIKKNIREGKTEVLDADLKSYFDTIPHEKLKKTVELRIADKRMLKLISLWLKSPTQESGKLWKSGRKGTPQGGVISPLLANIYMHLIDRIVNNKNSIFYQAGIKIVRYADDYILMGEQITKEANGKLKELLTRMELHLNKEKTQQVDAREKAFDFLGFIIRYDESMYDAKRRYWNIFPSGKTEKKLRENIRLYLQKRGQYQAALIVEGLNRKTRGWINYLDIPKVSYVARSIRKLRHYLQILQSQESAR